jgi:hypothetical protein
MPAFYLKDCNKARQNSHQKGDAVMLKYYLRYARYILASLAAVGFGRGLN